MLRAILFTSLICVSQLVAGASQAGDLIIHVTGIRGDAGNIRFALHNDPAAFPEGEDYAGDEVIAKSGKLTTVFKDLPPGAYALAIHHDENGDEEMNTMLFGIPKEGYGFSNDARVIFDPPDFAAAAFEVKPEGAEITLSVRY
jgi:uncharacterized protein (DUF2141 family)